jgi:putative permease
VSSLRTWFDRQLSNPQIVTLGLIILVLALTVYFFGNMLAPLFAAVVIAYLLEGIVSRLERRGAPHLGAVLIVFLSFFAFLLFAAFGLLPMLVRQLTSFAQQVPTMIAKVQAVLMDLPQRFSMITERQIEELLSGINSEILGVGQTLLSYSLSSLITAITVGVYLVLVPILVFFLLKDRDDIIGWVSDFLPTDRILADQVWAEVDGQIGNYARGKTWEIFIVGSVTFSVFTFLGLQYSLLLAVITGFSVLVPYIGAFIVTLPVAGVAIFQFGLQPEFYWVLIAYGIIQFLDGNLQRGCQSAPGGHHRRNPAVRWPLGFLGSVFRDPPGDSHPGSPASVAQRPEVILGRPIGSYRRRLISAPNSRQASRQRQTRRV